MKLTLEIPTEHTATIVAMLSTLMKPSAVESQPNPAEERFASRLPTPDDNRPRLIPVPGKFYWTRHGKVINAERITLNGDIECNCDDGPFFYQADGTPRAAVVCSPDWDLVEECPF